MKHAFRIEGKMRLFTTRELATAFVKSKIPDYGRPRCGFYVEPVDLARVSKNYIVNPVTQ